MRAGWILGERYGKRALNRLAGLMFSDVGTAAIASRFHREGRGRWRRRGTFLRRARTDGWRCSTCWLRMMAVVTENVDGTGNWMGVEDGVGEHACAGRPFWHPAPETVTP